MAAFPLSALVKSAGAGIEHERTRSDGAICDADTDADADADAAPLFLRREHALDRDWLRCARRAAQAAGTDAAAALRVASA